MTHDYVLALYALGFLLTLVSAARWLWGTIKRGEMRECDEPKGCLSVLLAAVMWPMTLPIIVLLVLCHAFCTAARKAGEHEQATKGS